jgi:T5SS/PEP-CTERM-associated repeat protein/autotransporter-associated beta strand protein
LNVSDGGAVVVGGGIYTSLSNLSGNGTISANGGVLDADLVFDAANGSHGLVIFGSGGTLTITPSANNELGVGYKGTGALRIADGVTISSSRGYLGYNEGSTGTAIVTGNGSKWTNANPLVIGYKGNGTLAIEVGGQVSNTAGYLGLDYKSGSVDSATVTGFGSKWTNYGTLYVGYMGTGILNIGSGIASDGVVVAKSVTLASVSTALGTCNLNGGTLQTGKLSKGYGPATFNWSDGTIRNYDASTDLTVYSENSLILKLAATGTHAFFIDSSRTGTVAAVLSDSTSGGTLAKLGEGTLTLSGANTYTGKTTISAGIMKLTSSGSLASSLIDVQSGATFDVSAKSNYSLATGKTLTGSGTIVGKLSVSGIHAPGDLIGIETVKGNYSLLGQLQIELAGTTAGSGYDQVLQSGTTAYTTTLGGTLALDWTGFGGSTDSTKLWILKNDTAGRLSGRFSNYANGASLGVYDGRSWCLYYGADAATGSLTGGNDVVISAVPEPATIVLLGMFAMGFGAVGWRRRK